jgi:hypothetical protein
LKGIIAIVGGTVGVVLGALSVTAGVALAVFSMVQRDSLAEGAGELADGLSSAEQAVRVLGEDFGSSTSLLGRICISVTETSRIVDITAGSVEDAVDAGEDLVTASRTAAAALDRLSLQAALLLGPNDLSTSASHLRAAADAGERVIASMDSLSLRMDGLGFMLLGVASSVDSLRSDLSVTREVMAGAAGRLAGLESLARSASAASFPTAAGVVGGILLVLTGLQQIVLSSFLGRMGAESRPVIDRVGDPPPA